MKIGLALGAGAARGWTHIGIIQALEKLGIKIDVVAGCSIGAYVGAAYASGKLEGLKEWSCSLSDWQVLALMGVGLRRGGIASGQKVFDKLATEFCAPSYEEMEKPFASVATDLYTGREVVFNSGEIGNTIQASCAIPALFAPVAHGDRWLVDGAVVNPVPVNLCRQLGADFVIAVNLNADFRPLRLEKLRLDHEENQRKTEDFFTKSQNVLKQWFSPDSKEEKETKEESEAAKQNEGIASEAIEAIEETISPPPNKVPKGSPPGILSVMSSSLEILQARVTRSRLAGDPPDILIEPQLTDVGIMEFHRAEELCIKGEETITRIAEQIKYQLLA
ncbi:patatin-like phospholipase family protein [Alteromonas sp. 1_MG-2023]|uniref:patatin-like phospholipase family protein n=1 Tax=Alteromonas sp. 1_MG-2023 TaxID=3062669 RepID=UPI0026E41B49|nr:patatin-like phospholipase family protein [Alteromonas sp. 1_MG-2023]MDO6565844.1 patatin-like phospholipase family protein [Alteromonas sp. 1_MG-2023]